MTKSDLETIITQKGISSAYINSILKRYTDFDSLSYMSVYNPTNAKVKPPCDFLNGFGDAYNEYGIYIFYNPVTSEIKYIGEAAEEAFSKRLTQHFNSSHGGLRSKYKTQPLAILDIESCEILILFGAKNAKVTHFDEDLLIGIFRPIYNDR